MNVLASFRCLRHLKTYLKNSMTETVALTTGLALMSTHKDIHSERVLRELTQQGVNLSS